MKTDELLIRGGLTRRHFFLLSGGAAVAGLSGLPALAQEAVKAGGVLKVVAPTNPSSLDPATGGSGFDHSFLWTIHDTLVEWDYDTLVPHPGLAAWAFPDPKTMVLDIVPDVFFHDGTPLDAAAVKFNIERGRDDERSNIKADLANVDSVNVTGPLQVTLGLKSPDSALPAILSDRAGMMASPAAIAKHGADSNRNPVGCGPWKFVSWTDNDRVVVTRNENYRRAERPLLDGIEFVIIPESATGLRSVTSGGNDMIYQVPARLKAVLDRTPAVQQFVAPTLACAKFYLNFGRAPFDNLKVRQALNFAIDRQAFIAAALGGVGEPAAMLLPKAHWAYDGTLADLYPYDPDRARALLAEAGHKDGLELNLGGFNDQDQVLRSEIMQAQLEKAGFKPRFTRGNLPEIAAQFYGNEKKFDALLSLWTGRPDPSMTYGSLFGGESYYNAGRTAEPSLTALLARSREVEKTEERAKVFSELQRNVMENALTAPIAFSFELSGLVERFAGYEPNLLGKPKFDAIHIV